MSFGQQMTWKGTPLEKMTKRELIEVVEFLYQQQQADRDAHQKTLDAWSAANERRAEAQNRRWVKFA